MTSYDEYLFHEGKHLECYKFMGSHIRRENREMGVRFTTWAPNTSDIYVIGDFSNWEIKEEFKMIKITENGLWTTFIKGVKKDNRYKFAIKDCILDKYILKSDPYARFSEFRPLTASVVIPSSSYKWSDKSYIKARKNLDIKKAPINIYEVHLGSWRRNGENYLTYEELKDSLVKYVKEMNYTHVEFMPLSEHPLDESWGYQSTGFYSVTSRFGNPEQLKDLINEFHKNNIGVIMDWVPSHFCKDEHGLYNFDGDATYEYEETWKAENKNWGTHNFDLGRPEVKSFLLSNAMYWIKEFHIDGIRVDAVSNMIYLSYGKESDEWIANEDGSNTNSYAIEFLKELSEAINSKEKGIILAAEESTTYPDITKPVLDGGLGFNLKWNLGWMNDSLKYVEVEQCERAGEHNKLTFAMMYNHTENFILPISHDEVVHGKKSLLNKMAGDYWNKFAGIRTFMGYMIGHPGKKLMFMGCEFGQFIEWCDTTQLDWKLINEYEMHKNTQEYFKDLNLLYLENNALWELDHEHSGFEWIEADNREQSIYIFKRQGIDGQVLIFICNFTSKYYENYIVGVPLSGEYIEILNSDNSKYGGSGKVNEGIIKSIESSYQNMEHSININIAPMATMILKFK